MGVGKVLAILEVLGEKLAQLLLQGDGLAVRLFGLVVLIQNAMDFSETKVGDRGLAANIGIAAILLGKLLIKAQSLFEKLLSQRILERLVGQPLLRDLGVHIIHDRPGQAGAIFGTL